MKRLNPAKTLEKMNFPDSYRGVNPSISDSATYYFNKASEMRDTFEGKTENMFLYSRHTSPSNYFLENTLAAMEGTESAYVTASGMGAISSTILQICGSNDHIIAGRTIYGGSYAFMKNFLPKLNIHTDFVDVSNIEAIEQAAKPETKLIYVESVSNPLLEVPDIPAIAEWAHERGIILAVDNTFSPLIMTPHEWGADIVIHSLTKFINGMNDTVGGVVCSTEKFVESAKSVINGAAMLLGSTLDSIRSANILKNTKTLAIRIRKHSENAMYLAKTLEKNGYKVGYPGLASHPQHELFKKLHHPEFGFGGMITIDTGSLANAEKFMEMMQQNKLGYLAVSLGFYRTLFNAPGTGTSSEVPEDEQSKMGLTPGLVRFSMGLDEDIQDSTNVILECLKYV